MIDSKSFRQKLAQIKEPTVVRTFAPGLEFELRRVPLTHLVVAGVLPDRFYREIVAANSKDGLAGYVSKIEEAVRYKQMTRAEADKAIAEKRNEYLNDLDADTLATVALAGTKLILAAVVSPKLVAGEPQNEDEISLLEIPEETQNAIMAWVFAGCPGIPISLKGGQITSDDLARFPDEERRRESEDAGDDRQQVRKATIGTAGDS